MQGGILRFKLFGFPVTIHWAFWLVGFLLGYNLMKAPPPYGIQLVLLWIVAVFVSILWHELGHAFAFRRFGIHSDIFLYSFGGLCRPMGAGRLTPREDIVVSLAGPAAGLLLGGVVFGVTRLVVPSNYQLAHLVSFLLQINIFWSLVNLLPVLPLDGGRVFAAAVAHKPRISAPLVGAVTGGVVAVIALRFGEFFIAVLFAMLAYSNWQRSRGRDVRFF